MRLLRRIPSVVLPLVLVLAGGSAALAGVYLLAGLAPTLVVGGAAAVVAGLVVDV